MPSFRTRRVAEIVAERPGLQRVRLDDGSRAFALTALTGTVAPGDEVVVNTTAVELGLGTGGWHVVHWNLSRRELDLPGGGHIMKVRYTSLQADVGAAEEHRTGAGASDQLPELGGRPVLVGSLHSQLGVVAPIVKTMRPALRLVYVMTDGAALPIALSDLVHDLRERSLLDGTVTAGHAFGGELEAVSTASAIELAVTELAADVVVVAMGPGVVGTSSALGTSAVEVAAVIDAVDALGGRPVAVARASDGDTRERHRAISHHTRTALRLARAAAEVPLPAGPGFDELARLIPPPHRTIGVEVPEIAPLLDSLGLRVTTMGRGPDADPLFFAVAAAAGLRAIQLSPPDGTVQAR